MGRYSGANGNAQAVLPPAILSPVTRYVQPRKPRRRWVLVGKFFAAFFALVVLIALGSAGGAYLYYHESVTAVAAHTQDVKVAQKALHIVGAHEPAIALVIGYDKRKGDTDRGRSDTLMLLRADPITKSISMLSFPRDLITPVWCGNTEYAAQRINQAYALCGSKGAVDTVKKLTGLPINYLITVNFKGFIEVVDRVGGVWVDVDRRYYNRNVGTAATNYANINLRPGYQRLKGRDALSYVRFRHTDSDLFRLARQQQFVKALKQQISSNFSPLKIPKLVGAIRHNVEVGQAGGGSLEKAITRYAFFAFGLPSGHFFQSKINVTGYNELSAAPESIASAVQEFQTPDVEAPQNATAVTFGRKAAGIKTLPPSSISITVLNGNGVPGSAANAAYSLDQKGYRIVISPNAADQNAPNFKYFHTMVYYDKRQPSARVAGKKIADLFGDAELKRLPAALRAKAQGARVTVVVGSTFHGTLAPAPVDKTPKKEPATVRSDPSQSISLLRSIRKKVKFRLMVPKVIERSSSIDREVPLRVYSVTKGKEAVRLTFLAGIEQSAYWGIEETSWNDAPVLEHPSFKHKIKGREFYFYYNGAHLHMVVLKTKKASYWVVNTLDELLSNETMIEIAKGLKPLG
jgi:LCP family protein required for cell wall assembly